MAMTSLAGRISSAAAAGPTLNDVRSGVSKAEATLVRNRGTAASHGGYRTAASESSFLHGSLKLGQAVITRSVSQSHSLRGITVCSQTSPLSTAAGSPGASTAWETTEGQEDSRNGVLLSNGSVNQRIADDRDGPFYGDRSRSYSTVAGVRNSDWGDVEAYDTFSEEEDSEDDEDSDLEEGEVVHVPAHADESRDDLAVENLGISEVLVNALIARGIARLFPIQEAVMKPAMAGRDIIARAKTGTGKTLAFGIPILEKITREIEANGGRRAVRNPRSLVLAPTRELAKQVEREFMESAPNLSVVCVYGGVSLENQVRQIKRGADIIVGTPGRLIDLIDRRALVLQDVQFMVLDEADQMLAVGFEEDVEKIMENLPGAGERQVQLFSATMPKWVKNLSRKYLTNPLTIDLVGEDEEKLAENISLMAVKTPRDSKRAILTDLITVHNGGGKTIVFTATKKDADEVALTLGRALGCEALHGDIAQAQRERTLQAFREGRFSVLVATDVASRGLDIPNVDLVIHYEVPNDPETFVHRTGRTGRAGKSGSAVLMYSPNQSKTLRTIEKDVGCHFEHVSPPSSADVMAASARQSVVAISRVHPELAESFLETAEELYKEKGVMALAAAIAHVSGFTQPLPPRSLLTFEEGLITVRVTRSPRSRMGPLSSPRSVMGMLSEIHKPAADSVGKIKILGDRNVNGAVFDLPEAMAKQLLKMCNQEDDDVFDLPKELPRVIEEDAPSRDRDPYGRFSSRGGGGDRGGRDSRGGGSRGGGSRDSFRDRERGGGGSYGRRDSMSRGGGGGDGGGSSYERERGGRSERFGSPRRTGGTSSGWESDGGSSRFSRSSTGSRSSSRPFSTDPWSSSGSGATDSDEGFDSDDYRGGGYSRGGGSSSRGSGAGFSGVCFLCRQPGHRAVDCPTGRR